MLYIFETLGEVKGRYFLPASVLLFLLHKQNPDVTWGEKNGTKVKLLLFLQESGLAQLQPFGPNPGRSPAGVAGSGAGAGPASIPAGDRTAQRAASLRPWAPSQIQPSPGSRGQASWGCGDLRKRAGVLRSWDARQGWREGKSSGRWGRLSPPALAGCAGNVVSSGRALVCGTSSRPTSTAVPAPSLGRKCRPFTSKICQKRKS